MTKTRKENGDEHNTERDCTVCFFWQYVCSQNDITFYLEKRTTMNKLTTVLHHHFYLMRVKTKKRNVWKHGKNENYDGQSDSPFATVACDTLNVSNSSRIASTNSSWAVSKTSFTITLSKRCGSFWAKHNEMLNYNSKKHTGEIIFTSMLQSLLNCLGRFSASSQKSLLLKTKSYSLWINSKTHQDLYWWCSN